MRGVTRRDHAEVARRVGQGRRGLRDQHVPLEGLFLLLQSLIDLLGAAQLVRALGRGGRQPQRDAQAHAQRPDDQHDERHPRDQPPRVEVHLGDADEQPLPQRGANNLGRLGLASLGPGLGLRGALGARRRSRRPGERRGLWAGTGRLGPLRPDVALTALDAGVSLVVALGFPFATRAPGHRFVGTATRGTAARIGVGVPSSTAAAYRCWPLCHHRPPLVTTFSRARRRTDALRGFNSSSCSSARSAPRVSEVKSGS